MADRAGWVSTQSGHGTHLGVSAASEARWITLAGDFVTTQISAVELLSTNQFY